MHDQRALHNTELLKLLAQIFGCHIEEQVSNIQGGLRERPVTDVVAALVSPAAQGPLPFRADRLDKLNIGAVFRVVLGTIC